MSSLYKSLIIDHYKNPQNRKKIADPTHTGGRLNASCGDEIKLSLVIKDDVVVDIGYEVIGCAISVATASLLTERIKGMTLDEVKKFDSEKFLLELGLERTSGRIKCAMISIDALHEAIDV